MDQEEQPRPIKKGKKIERKPKSRAEAARRTKALLALREGNEGSAQEVEEEEYEPAKKKRQYRKKSKPIERKAKQDEDGEAGSGKYIHNPCDIGMEKVCTKRCLEVSDSEEEHDPYLSVPLLRPSDKEEGPDGAMDPLRRQLNEMEMLFNGLSVEYRKMNAKVDKMKLNLFADTTKRRFDPRVVHNIDFLSKESAWPLDLLPESGRAIPKYQHQIWMKRPFNGLVRIRPNHARKDKMVSAAIDKLTGAVPAVTKEEIEQNVMDLVMSKLNKTPYTPLPSCPTRNPFDVPEIFTRIVPRAVSYYGHASYVQKIPVVNIDWETSNEKRKRKKNT